VQFDEMTSMEIVSPDVFVGRGPHFRGDVLFGGQVLAQSVIASANTVDPAYTIHSLHAYFLRRGVAEEPIDYEISRLRDGRTFVTRSITARQAGGVILQMTASYQAAETDPFQPRSPFPRVPPPEELEDASWSPTFERRVATQGDGRIAAWLRIPAAPGDNDQVRAAAALAFMSDDLPIGAVRSRRHADEGDAKGEWFGVSLDHSIWFHRAPKPGAWQLHVEACETLGMPRGLARNQVFGPDGSHLATVTQELLLVSG
jgi:acyl-CoA thioesterase-2